MPYRQTATASHPTTQASKTLQRKSTTASEKASAQCSETSRTWRRTLILLNTGALRAKTLGMACLFLLKMWLAEVERRGYLYLKARALSGYL